MPLVAPALTGILTTSLLATGMIGTATPQLASGIAMGVCLWAQQQQVLTVDAGALGVGAGIAPMIVPPPLLITNLLVAYAANGQIGPMAPLEATGLGTGLGLGFATAILQTVHPTVGTGAGVGTIQGPPAFPSLMQGFASVGIKGQGSVQKANAISMALMVTMAALVFPIPIVGAPSPLPGAGVGTGVIL